MDTSFSCLLTPIEGTHTDKRILFFSANRVLSTWGLFLESPGNLSGPISVFGDKCKLPVLLRNGPLDRDHSGVNQCRVNIYRKYKYL